MIRRMPTNYPAIMNILQSIVGCMYPGSTRTESIESMDHDYPECRFKVANIDEHENEVSEGELHLTDRDLIYFRPGRIPTRWPIDYIRRYGCSPEGKIFSFEAGRRCPTGQAIFAFRLSGGADLVNKLREKIDMSQSIEATSENGHHDYNLLNCRLNKFNSPQHSDRLHSTPDHQRPSNQKVPHLDKQRKRDASTSTENQQLDMDQSKSYNNGNLESADPRPLSYAMIDFSTTRALNESAQAHAASRVREKSEFI